MTPKQALAFVRKHGVVLASAKGPVPNLAEAIAGAPIKGSWWAHPKGRAIFNLFQAIEQAPDVLICRAVGGKLTFVHRHLWPALVRAAKHLPADHLAQIHQEHTEAGHHENKTVAFPKWVPPDVKAEAAALTVTDALAALGPWVTQAKSAKPPATRPKR